MKLLSINTGRVGNLLVRQHDEMRRIASAIYKQPVSGPVTVRKLGLLGDEQADPSVHGGIDKAVYAYPVEHYPFWSTQRTRALKREESLAFGYFEPAALPAPLVPIHAIRIRDALEGEPSARIR